MPNISKLQNGLSFGLAGVDHLIDPDALKYFPDQKHTYSAIACIVGPDGVGKSILGLSLASTYAASTGPEVKVIYASTDFNYRQAKRSWEHFGLDLPKQRRRILRDEIESLVFGLEIREKLTAIDDSLLFEHCELKWVTPAQVADDGEDDRQPFGSIFEGSREPKEDTAIVHFLDLARYSAGDDWGRINQTIGLLRVLENRRTKGLAKGTPKAQHLLIIDAVEGLEAMAGRFDRFGLERSRRSRLAQIVRLGQKSSCHIVFIVEQKNQDRLDEVFVSDLVLRLRAEQNDEYLQKTIEVEKARSVSHIRGKHELQIRSGKGEESDSPDDPSLTISRDGKNLNLGYLQVIPSLHQKR